MDENEKANNFYDENCGDYDVIQNRNSLSLENINTTISGTKEVNSKKYTQNQNINFSSCQKTQDKTQENIINEEIDKKDELSYFDYFPDQYDVL